MVHHVHEEVFFRNYIIIIVFLSSRLFYKLKKDNKVASEENNGKNAVKERLQKLENDDKNVIIKSLH